VRVVLRSIQKSRWYNATSALSWLPPSALQADVLKDLSTTGNKLSVFVIEEESVAIERIAVAMATTKQYFKEFDYALFDYGVLDDLAIKHEKTYGATPDSVVNAWHLDLVELTVDKITAVARTIRQNGTLNRIREKTIASLTVAAVRANRLEMGAMPPEMRERIERELSS
jgi:hypothetical protein